MKFSSFFLFLLLLNCHPTERIQAWPLVHYQEEPQEEESTLEILSPFFYSFTESGSSGHSFRPLYDYREDEDSSDLVFLWPIGRISQGPDRTKIQLIPLYYYSKRIEEDGTIDTDWFVALILWGGSDESEKDPSANQSYFGVFPIYGTIRGILGKDEIYFIGFPCYYSTKDGEYHTENYLWPFFSFGEGGGKEAASFFPFYGYSQKKNSEGQWKYKREYYLWPIFAFQENQLDKKYPVKALTVFPFYGESVSEVSQAYTVLWPFFSVSFDESKKYSEYNLPWPFFKSAKGKDIEEFRLWPFYGEKIRPQNKDYWCAWPLLWWNEQENESFSKDGFWALPFYWSSHRKSKEEPMEEDFYKFWPLFHYASNHQQNLEFQLLSPLWFEDYHPEGFKKLYTPIWSLFSMKSNPEGDSLRVLGPIYYSEDTKNSYQQNTLLYNYEYEKKNGQKTENNAFTFLYGLFGLRHQEDKTYLKLFYLPEFISW
ncbi:MAG: hypothetical protein AABZ60_20345 [Planctomycetota bacterium]